MWVRGGININNTFYKKGHITVFLSLILTLILSLVCTTIESARIQGVRMQLQNITDMGIFSVFGEYNQDLLNIYDLFFLDMGYGTNDVSSERVSAQIKKYTEYNTDVDKGLPVLSLFPRADMWRADIDGVNTEKYVIASDNKGKAYYSQAVEYMKDTIGITIAEELLDQYDASIMEDQEEFKNYEEDNSNSESEIESAKDDYKASYNQALDEANGDESEVELEKPTEVSNPLDTIKNIKGGSILQLVMEDYTSISDKIIQNYNSVPSKRDLKAGDGTFQGQDNNAINKVLFNEYLFEKFPNMLSEERDESSEVLQYQAEYILCGKKSDKANLESVVNKLLLMREGINFVYLLADNVKRTQASELATLIIGYLPWAIPILTIAILLAWAFAESVLEVRMLLSGKKVVLLKNAENWNLGLDNLANLSEMLDSGEESEGGIDYEGYLKMLMFFENNDKKTMRSLDLVELIVQDQSSNSNFKIDNCTQQFTTTINYNVGSLFLRLPFKTLNRGNSSYNYSVTRDFSYY